MNECELGNECREVIAWLSRGGLKEIERFIREKIQSKEKKP